MTNILIAVILAVLAGMAVTIQSPLASILNQRIGQIESVFIVHIGGTIVSGIILLFLSGGNMRAWRNTPWYTWLAGILGLVVIASVNIAIVRLGSVATVSIMVAAQLALGAILDHFGWLGLDVRPLTLPRVIGMIVMGLGAWLVVR
jgi:bacterial/archaeal transporter family-2 protein